MSRDSIKGVDRQEILRVSFPNYKLGEEVVKRVPVPPTCGETVFLFLPNNI